jgi:hypothetical protein
MNEDRLHACETRKGPKAAASLLQRIGAVASLRCPLLPLSFTAHTMAGAHARAGEPNSTGAGRAIRQGKGLVALLPKGLHLQLWVMPGARPHSSSTTLQPACLPAHWHWPTPCSKNSTSHCHSCHVPRGTGCHERGAPLLMALLCTENRIHRKRISLCHACRALAL